jgi:ABC-2 type transport system ATP-binding protein
MTITTTASTVAAEGLVKSFGATRAVHELSLHLSPGVVGLLGPNGAGKTTLLRMLATVLAPDDGRLTLLGRDPARAAERLEIRRRLGYLPQSPALYPGFTAFDLVDYVALLKEHTDATWRREECRRVLDAVGLGDEMHRKVKTLSGGMRQRVGLATALIGSPELLVLDEPATGLDPDQRLRLRSVLSRAAASATVVLSTHNTAEVAALCQEVYVVLHGRVRFRGTPAQLAAVAHGRVWVDDREDAQAVRCWQTAEGTFRHLGTPPSGAELIEPTLDDGYLLIAREGRTS